MTSTPAPPPVTKKAKDMLDPISSTTNSTQVTPTEYSGIPTQAQIAHEFGGDASAELAAMVFLFSRERSRHSAEQRDQIERHIQQFESSQVEKMHQSADATYDAALKQSAGQLINGTLSFAGSAAGDDWGPALQASGDATQGAFNLWAANDKLEADNLSADAEHAGNKAGSYERSLETVNSDADDAKSMKDAVYDFLQSIVDSKAEANKALVGIRG